MAKPINITPVLRGRDAIKFLRKIEDNKSKKVSKSVLEAIKKDAEILRTITK